ncbi:dioxygenase family protein [Archangium lipolyticum]|uniref:dioxygenase family protein n=1 Tax=Archangium lipolyticum TaxID=2970465 RepID=UPI00214A03DF|nr:protocatechuate 3,4-dioxygenase [Archangium lipolyticum]
MSTTTKNMTRREILGGLGLTLAAVPLSQLLACGGEGPATSGWATGGTAAMTGASSYPNPFTASPGTVCKLTCEQILGPCYGNTEVRKDISEGHAGLPVRLAFRVLNEACEPIPGATVDIWHAGPAGVYSGEDQHPFCNPDNQEARAARWFRGVQTTDADGRVDFDTCFPGWYAGRAIHIHFTIKIAGTESVTSQLYFEDSLNDDIIGTQPLYNTRGQRDTRNTADTVVAQEKMGDFILQTQKMPDGALLAWKTLIVRSSASTPSCEAHSQQMKDLMNSGIDPNDASTFPPDILTPKP